MKVVISGATGFIGSHLVAALLERGDSVVALTRGDRTAQSPNLTYVRWAPPVVDPSWASHIEGAGAVINLAGEPVADRRWNAARKQAILESRIDATRAIAEAIHNASAKPSILVNGSAMGYYGPNGLAPLTESSPAGTDFLAGVCAQWESAAEPVSADGVRLVCIRTSIVLGTDGGALPRFVLPFKLFNGGVMGPADQMVSWIHIADEVALILFSLDNQSVTGPVNAASPNPVDMATFSHAIGAALHRPCWVPGLAKLLSLVLGERTEVVFASQRVIPEKALATGFTFTFPTVDSALGNLLTH